MASKTVPSSVSEYNRQLLVMSNWYDVQISNTITYVFRFEGHDDNQVIPSDYQIIERSYLMGEREIEKIWDEIAEQNHRHFVRGDVKITYPNCLLAYGITDEF